VQPFIVYKRGIVFAISSNTKLTLKYIQTRLKRRRRRRESSNQISSYNRVGSELTHGQLCAGYIRMSSEREFFYGKYID
jgi:hypothetical protein